MRVSVLWASALTIQLAVGGCGTSSEPDASAPGAGSSSVSATDLTGSWEATKIGLAEMGRGEAYQANMRFGEDGSLEAVRVKAGQKTTTTGSWSLAAASEGQRLVIDWGEVKMSMAVVLEGDVLRLALVEAEGELPLAADIDHPFRGKSEWKRDKP